MDAPVSPYLTQACWCFEPARRPPRPTQSSSGSTGQASNWGQSGRHSRIAAWSCRRKDFAPPCIARNATAQAISGCSNLERGSTARLTFEAAQHNQAPVWSPDGRQIFFSRNTNQTWAIYSRDSSGVGDEKLLHEVKGFGLNIVPLGVSPDGQRLVFRDANRNVSNRANQGDLLGVVTVRRAQGVPYLQDLFNQGLGQFSTDGRWIAYPSFESGRSEIYVQSFPSPGTRYQVSTGSGQEPRWRRDGRELFYRVTSANNAGTAGLMSVNVETTGTGLGFGIPERLFDSSAAVIGAPHSPWFSYSVTADGQRFLVARELGAAAADPAETPLTVVLNWMAALPR